MGGPREVVVWGSGTPRREFLYVDDLADAGIHLLRHYSGDMHINIGASSRHHDCGTCGRDHAVRRF